MKKLLFSAAIAALSLLAVSCEKEPTTGTENGNGDGTVAVETVTVTATPSTTVEVGGMLEVKAVVLPENATDKAVAWSSSAEAVATVNSLGLVTAVAPGEAQIIATAGGVQGSVTITVTEPVVQKELGFSELVEDPQEISAGVYAVELPLGQGYSFAGEFDFKNLFVNLPADATFELAPVNEQNSEVSEYYESLTGNLAADGTWTRNARFAHDLNVSDENNAANGVRVYLKSAGNTLMTVNFYIVDPIKDLPRTDSNGHVFISSPLMNKLNEIYGPYGGLEMELGGSQNWADMSLYHGDANDFNLAAMLNDVTNFQDQGPYFSGNDPEQVLFKEWPKFGISGTNGEEIFYNDTKAGNLALSEYGAQLCKSSKGVYWELAWCVYVNCANWQLPEAERPTPTVGNIAEGAPINGTKDWVEAQDAFREHVGIYITPDGHLRTTAAYKGAGARLSPRLHLEYDYGYACVSTRYMFMLFVNRRWAGEGEIGDVTLGSN